MRWLGLDATTLALTLLGAGAALLLLYLQKRPARRVVVPALALWSTLGDERRRPSAWLSRARRLVSLLLALGIVSALVLALGEPERVDPAQANNLVLLLDCSPSMAARDVAPSRIEQAKTRARRLVRQLGAHDQAWIVGLGDSATPLTSRTRDKATLLRAIDRLSTQEQPADLTLGVQLALDLLAPFARAELVLLSDGALLDSAGARTALARAPKIAVRQERVGTSARNVAITQLAARPYLLDHAHREVLVTVQNFGPANESLRLQVFAADVLLAQEHIALAAAASATRVLADLPASDAPLRARLELDQGTDVLRGDDAALMHVGRERTTRVLAVSADNRYLEAALLLDDTLEVDQLAPAAYRSSAGYDLVIFDGTLPREPPGTPALYLGPFPGSGSAPLPRAPGADLGRPFFDHVQREHPLVRELSLADVNVGHATRFVLLPSDNAIAATADRVPLIVEGMREGKPFVLLSFDLRDSDLPLRAAFPLFFLRTLARLRGESATESRVQTATLRAESSAPVGDLLGAPRTAVAHRSHTPWLEQLWPVLLALALLLLVLEWFTFHRGYTE
ncbi:MAG: hypothetical protein JWN48_2688 [Myxococcaceae bacterium]|nr:hypothetical protein [Myxococcaceae bacterium]